MNKITKASKRMATSGSSTKKIKTTETVSDSSTTSKQGILQKSTHRSLSPQDPPILLRDKANNLLGGIKLENLAIVGNKLLLQGWCIGFPKVGLVSNNIEVPVQVTRKERQDVLELSPIANEFDPGFEITATYDPQEAYILRWELTGDQKKTSIEFMLDIDESQSKKTKKNSLPSFQNGTPSIAQSNSTQLQAQTIKHVHCNIDEIANFIIRGWCLVDGRAPRKMQLSIGDTEYPLEFLKRERKDVAKHFGLNKEQSGFEIPLPDYIWDGITKTNAKNIEFFLLADGLVTTKKPLTISKEQANNWSEEILKSSVSNIASLTSLSAFSGYLFKARRLADLLKIHLSDQQRPYSPILKRLFDEIEEKSEDNFDTIEEFYLYIADQLSATKIATLNDIELGKRFYRLVLSTQKTLPSSAHILILTHFLRHHDFTGARKVVVQAVIDAMDDPGVLVHAAKIMKAIDEPGIARLLFGRALEINPDIITTDTLSEKDDKNNAWLAFSAILDLSNQNNAPKFGTITNWLKIEGKLPSDKITLSRERLKTQNTEFINTQIAEFSQLVNNTSLTLLVDPTYYSSQAGDNIDDLEQTLVHYFEKGYLAGLNLHPAFDISHIRYQLQKYDIDSTTEPLILLFFRYEIALSLSPNPLFDPNFYRQNAGIALNTSPWLHYISGGWQDIHEISDFLDTNYFMERIPPYSAAALPPLIHLFCKAPLGEANQLFHAQFYYECYKNHLDGKPPLVHYLSEGVFQGFAPNPFFQPAGKSVQERIDYIKLSKRGF
jgi:hypothetical protein